jgi:hypothetical protein
MKTNCVKCLFLALLAIVVNTSVISAENIVKDISVKPFSSVEVSTVCNVFLIQGDKESVRVESDKDLSDILSVENNGEKLIIGIKEGRKMVSSSKMDIYITFRMLNAISVKVAGNIESNNTLKMNDLNLSVKAAGNLNLSLSCTKLEANLKAMGNVNLKGSAKETVLNCKGLGNINANDFKVENLTVNLQGTGNVKVYAVTEISIDASGTGNISYKGKPTVKHLSKSGTGSVKAE